MDVSYFPVSPLLRRFLAPATPRGWNLHIILLAKAQAATDMGSIRAEYCRSFATLRRCACEYSRFRVP
jgi:hypothetical protein